MTTVSISGEELALKSKLLRAFSAALNTSSEKSLEDRDWQPGVPEDRPEFHAVLALLDQGAGQVFTRIPGAVEAWLLGVSRNAYFFATDDNHSTMGSDFHDLMAFAICKAMLERGVELRLSDELKNNGWDLLQTQGTDLTPLIAAQRAKQFDQSWDHPAPAAKGPRF